MIDEIALRREELRAVCRRFHLRRLDLFGSAARGDFDPDHSDVDFIVEFERDTPLHPFDTYFGRKVDLVELSAVRNPYLKASIDGSREPVFEG